MHSTATHNAKFATSFSEFCFCFCVFEFSNPTSLLLLFLPIFHYAADDTEILFNTQRISYHCCVLSWIPYIISYVHIETQHSTYRFGSCVSCWYIHIGSSFMFFCGDGKRRSARVYVVWCAHRIILYTCNAERKEYGFNKRTNTRTLARLCTTKHEYIKSFLLADKNMVWWASKWWSLWTKEMRTWCGRWGAVGISSQLKRKTGAFAIALWLQYNMVNGASRI